MKVRLPERVLDEIEAKMGAAGGEVVGGLLIGHPEDGGWWVERILACPNAAAVDERATRYTLDPRALANVRKTLSATRLRVLGVYFGGGQATAIRPEEADAAGVSEPLRLVPATNGNGPAAPIVWAHPDRPLELEVVPPPARVMAFCPD